MNTHWPTQPGIHDLEVEQPAGKRRATLSLPSGDPSGAPLVLVLHYGGEPSGFYGRPLLEMLVLPALRDLGAVFIAPVAQGGDWTTPHNRDAVLALLDDIERSFGTDASRVIVVGYSMGAIGTWHLLDHCPGRFAAAVPLAGPAPALDAPLRTPVHAINSTADQLFPADATRAAIDALAAAGAPAAITLIDGADHYAVPRFGAALASLAPWIGARKNPCIQVGTL